MSNGGGRKRYLQPTDVASSISKATRPRFAASGSGVGRASVGGYRACYPNLNENVLKVYTVSNEPRPEFAVLEEQTRGREPITKREFTSLLDSVLANDCVTLQQMVHMVDYRPIDGGLANMLLKLRSDTEKYTIYALRSIPRIKMAGIDGRLSDVGHAPASLDRFATKSSFANVESVVVASTAAARSRWRSLRDAMLAKGNAIQLKHNMKQLTVLLLARLSVVTKLHTFSIEPRAIFAPPSALLTTVDGILNDDADGKGNVKFTRLEEAVLRRLEMHNGGRGSGVVRYLREYDWTMRGARLVRTGETVMEKELKAQDQPPERRTVAGAGGDQSRLTVMLRLRCRVRKCDSRFKNETVRMEHMERVHSITPEQMKTAKDADATDTTRHFQIEDEFAWLRARPFMEEESKVSTLGNLSKLAVEFAEMHSENRFKIATLTTEIALWREAKVMDSVCQQTRERQRELLEHGRKLMLDEDRYAGLVGMWAAVTRRRVDENRRLTEFIASKNRCRDDDPLVKLSRMNDADFEHTVQNLGGYDHSALEDAALGFDDVEVMLEKNGMRAGEMAFRLLNRQLDPDGERAIRNSRQRMIAMYGDDYKNRRNYDDDDDDDEVGGTVPGSVPIRLLTRRYDDDDDDRDDRKLVEMEPTAIRVHRLDAFEDIKRIVDEVMDPNTRFDRTAVGRAMTNVVNFTKRKFRLSKAGTEAAFNYCFGQLPRLVNVQKGDGRRRAFVATFAHVFRFFNSNQSGKLNHMFARRMYQRTDPSMEVVKVDECSAYEPLPGVPMVDIPVEGLRIAIEYDSHSDDSYADEVVLFQREHCPICLYEFGCRSLEAIPCAAIECARSMGKSAPDPRELIETTKGQISDWNGVHLFHASCLRELIRNRAKDTSATCVRCPTCRMTFHDAEALNVIRMKLVASNMKHGDGDDDEVDDDVFNVKSELGRSESFLISCQHDLDRLRESVKKIFKQKDMIPTGGHRARTDPTNQPYELGDVDWYTDSRDNVADDVDMFIAKLKNDRMVKCDDVVCDINTMTSASVMV